MGDCCIADLSEELAFHAGGQDFGLFSGRRPYGSEEFPRSGGDPSSLRSRSAGTATLEDDMATLSILDWDESCATDVRSLGRKSTSTSGCQGSSTSDSYVSSDSSGVSSLSSAKSRLFSAYSQTSSDSPGAENSQAPHVALHLVSELLDDESIASMGDAASSPPEDDDAVSPTSSDHGFPSPSTLASSWPGVLDFGQPVAYSHPHIGPHPMDTYSVSPWAAGNSAHYSGHEVNQAGGLGSAFLFLYDSSMANRQPPSAQQPMSPVGQTLLSSPSAEHIGSSQSLSAPASQFVHASAPVPVQQPQQQHQQPHHGRRNGPHHGTATSAPRAIAGKADYRRQRGQGHRARNGRYSDGYPAADVGGSLPSSLPSAHHHPGPSSGSGTHQFPPASAETSDQGARGSGQRKRRPHANDSRKASAAAQQVYDLVDKAGEHLSSLEAQRKEVEQSLNRICPSRRTGSNPSIRMPPNPSPADRVVVEQLREHAKVELLLSRIDRARSTPLHSNVGSTVDSWLSCLNELQSLRKQQRLKQPKRGHSLPDADAANLTPLLSTLNGMSSNVQSALYGAFKSSFDEPGPRSPSDCQSFSIRGVS